MDVLFLLALFFSWRYSFDAALFLLSLLYCFAGIVASLVFVNEEPLEFSDVRGGGFLICGILLPLGVIAVSKPTLPVLLTLGILFAVAVFLMFALWIGLVVRKAVFATIVFLVIYASAMGGTFWVFRHVDILRHIHFIHLFRHAGPIL